MPVKELTILLQINTPGKAAEEGPNARVPGNHARDLDEVLDTQLYLDKLKIL